MTSDDVLAHMASLPRNERACGLQSDSLFLAAWLKLRTDKQFYHEVVVSHGLHNCEDTDTPEFKSAIDYAWYLCVEATAKL